LITDVPPPSTGSPVELDGATFEKLFEHAGGLLAILDSEGRFLAVNPACRRVLGIDPVTLVGRSLLDFARSEAPPQALSPGGRPGEPGSSSQVFDLLARHRHADGAWRWLMWSGAIHGDRWYASARDVTDWIKLEDRVGRDPLTRLPNREVFTDEVNQALARQERSGRRLAVLFVDIDSLKQINDSIGHEAGDKLVAEVAERLRFAIRAGDVVARLGGDEFGILVESLGDELEAVTVAGRALAALDEPIELGRGGPISVSASIGVAVGHGPRDTAAELIHEADIAMYQAKAGGRNRFAIFDSELRAEVEKRRDLDRDLRAALEGDELALRYQPIVSLESGLVIGCEALLHWEHAERGVVPASEFLPLAEQNGLIVPLGVWARRTAAEQAAAWHAAGKNWFVAVNVSPRQLADEGFVGSVRTLLASTPLPEGALTVEVGEAAVLTRHEQAADRLGELHSLGVRIALDDFGTGYAPLRHLIQLPFDTIKLNPALIDEMAAAGARTGRAALIAVMAAARELEIDVIADGIETEEQFDALVGLGCSAAQGSVFTSPRPAAELTRDRYATLPVDQAASA
jgi:diguanylate cyclase (GGDEF)-like protein/PAS domain S-box-containing protein